MVAARNDAYSSLIGFSEATSPQTGIGSAATDLTGLSVTWTAEAGVAYKITAHARVTQQTSDGRPRLRVVSDGVTRVTSEEDMLAGSVTTPHLLKVLEPTAGSVTAKLQLDTPSGTVDLEATANSPATLVVEKMGR